MTINPGQSDLETKTGLVKRARKAFVAGAIGFAGSFGPAFAMATADGKISMGEVVPLLVVATGIGVAAAFAVFWTPNAT
jgi:hypothetical protein